MPRFDLEQIRRFIEENVPAGLRKHCERTAERAKALAAHHGVDERKVEAAALLHDFVKYYTHEELDAAIREVGYGSLELETMPEEVRHGPAGAILVEQQLAISDKEVLEAIRLHSTADEDMSDVAKIVFLADFTEEGRDLPESEHDRQMCLGDLDTAVLHVLGRKLAHVIGKRMPVDQRAWRAYNAFARRVAAKAEA